MPSDSSASGDSHVAERTALPAAPASFGGRHPADLPESQQPRPNLHLRAPSRGSTVCGPREAKFDKVSIRDGDYEGGQQGGPAGHPKTTQRLVLPTGQSDGGKIPQAKLNPASKHANERGHKGDKSRYTVRERSWD
jgi:hypothetical protein